MLIISNIAPYCQWRDYSQKIIDCCFNLAVLPIVAIVFLNPSPTAFKIIHVDVVNNCSVFFKFFVFFYQSNQFVSVSFHSSDPCRPKDAIRAMKKRLNGNRNYREVMLALTVS